ncbi:MAG: hypothetical protein H6618_08665 [Deltaproteobacteria bacterium]|nr:hypothetical protein [Deltaproteobacteria bacterium]
MQGRAELVHRSRFSGEDPCMRYGERRADSPTDGETQSAACVPFEAGVQGQSPAF